jgi:[ribosomal protein S5]-alanine N-acetyltransferase
VLSSNRLVVRKLVLSDYLFLIELLNSDGWQKFIGDRNVYTRHDAARYIEDITGKGLLITEPALQVFALKDGNIPIGLCGILVRSHLDAPDLGIALLPQYEGKSFAKEACILVMKNAKNNLGVTDLLAITANDNFKCHELLLALGMQNKGVYFDHVYSESLTLFSIKM